jgi:hypothetical protein
VVKVKGITKDELILNYETPPKFYRKVSSKPDKNGLFKVEVFKLKSLNTTTGEAIYTKYKEETVKSRIINEFTGAKKD